MTHLVLAYGTLRKGCGNHRLLEKARFVGDATIRGFNMYHLGGFPGVLNEGGRGEVIGEVYEVDDETMRRLDRLEGYDHEKDRGMYLRRTTTAYPKVCDCTIDDDGCTRMPCSKDLRKMALQVWYYQWNGTVNRASQIHNGDWVKRNENAS